METAGWCDEKGEPIHNWGKILAIWIHNHARIKKLRDPDRIPDARTSQSGRGGFVRRPSNYLEPSEAARKEWEDVFNHR